MPILSSLRDGLSDAGRALRLFRRQPVFAATAVVTLALGIGAPAAIFAVVNAVLIRPLPFADPDRLITFGLHVETPRGGPMTIDAVPAGAALMWAADARTLEGLALYNDRALTLTSGDGPHRLSGVSATPNLFDLLGATPALGRPFAATDQDLRQVVLGESAWRQYFHGDASIVGRTIVLDGQPYRVTGVMGRDFAFPSLDTAFWVPQALEAGGTRGMVLPAVARLASGAPLSAAVSEAQERLAGDGPPEIKTTVEARTLRETLVGRAEAGLWGLMIAVSLVSIVATASVAVLLLSRGALRGREFAVRLALGAGRGRLARQVLAEGLALSAAGALAGIGLAHAALRVLLPLAPSTLPRLRDVAFDGPVLAFTVSLALVSGVVFGLLSAGRLVVADALQRLIGPAGESRLMAARPVRRQLRLLAGIELAAATVLLMGAALLLSAFVGQLLVPQGYEARGALAFSVNLPGSRYPSATARAAFLDQLRPALAALPGVTAAGVAAELPHRPPTGRFAFAADPEALSGSPMTWPVYPTRMVGEGLMEAMGMPVRAGRTFTAADTAGAEPVVIISASLAREQFGDGEAVGRVLHSGQGDYTVVGVVDDVRLVDPAARAEPAAYLPLRQHADLLSWHAGAQIVLRAAGATGLAAAVRARVLALDPDLPAANVRPLGADAAVLVDGPRYGAALVGGFGVVALVLAAVAVYAVMAFLGAARTREIGVRLALGATHGQVVRVLAADGLVVIGAGLGSGLLAAGGALRAVATTLGDLPRAPWVFAAVTVALGASAALAVFLPAHRAARMDPVRAMRQD